MFADVIDWFLGRGSDRRQYKRRPGAFHMWWQPPGTGIEPRPGIGLEISPNGLMFIIPEKLPGNEYNLILRLNEVKIPVRVRTARSDQIQHQGKQWNRYMGEFVGIGADHWDMLVRYVNNEEEPPDRSKLANPETSKQDDAYRLLPLAIQNKIISKLVGLSRLERPQAGQVPLVKLFYGGLVSKPGEPAIHRINVHSRIVINDELMAYDTRFHVGDDGEVKLAP
jgi:hypothetical protein